MRFLFLLLVSILVACTGSSSHVTPDYSSKVPQRIALADTLFVVVGELPEGTSPKDIQIVAYQTRLDKKIAPYLLQMDYGYERKNGEPDLNDLHFYYRVSVEEYTPADEIVWYNKGIAYQTLKIEYTIKHGEIVSIQALWNGERRLCMNAYLDFDGRKFIHMPDYRTPEDERRPWTIRYAIFYDDPKCRETEKFNEPSY